MSKKYIDYSNTIIYKIVCKDESIKDVYVGHTTNFVQRKISHKASSINGNCKLYKIIRENGGWDNWSMDTVNFFNCKNNTEARQKEQEYFISLNATLNSVEPFQDKINTEDGEEIVEKTIKKSYICDKCNVHCANLNSLEAHINTHNKILLIDTNLNIKNFNCNICKFSAQKKSNYENHLTTLKHKLNINSVIEHTNILHICKTCNKTYSSRVGLWYHSKKCKELSPNDNIDIDTNELLKRNNELLKQNNELQKQILEYIKSK